VALLWPGDCQRRAVGSVLKAKGRAGQELTLAQKLHAVEQARTKNMEAGEREWGVSWRPVVWLTWILLGLPCAENEGYVMDTLGVARPGSPKPRHLPANSSAGRSEGKSFVFFISY
jgi:hypothetical protein